MSTHSWLQLEELERRDLLSSGDLDTTFNGTGIVDFNFGFTDHLRASVIQSNGQIVAAGDSDFGSNHANLALARFNSDGSLDTTFGSQGRVTTDVSLLGSGIRALALDGMGNTVAAGIFEAPGGVSHIVLARYKPDGRRFRPLIPRVDSWRWRGRSLVFRSTRSRHFWRDMVSSEVEPRDAPSERSKESQYLGMMRWTKRSNHHDEKERDSYNNQPKNMAYG